MAAAAILDFQILKILTVVTLKRAKLHHRAKLRNFVEIDPTTAEMWRFFYFS